MQRGEWTGGERGEGREEDRGESREGCGEKIGGGGRERTERSRRRGGEWRGEDRRGEEMGDL